MKDCNSCGKCCIKYSNGGLSASQDEINNWEVNNENVFNYVADGKIWADPITHQPLTLCPWLRKESEHQPYTCAIYHDRPDDCRVYPMTIQDMIKDECEMLEPADLTNLKQAQLDLDELVALSADY